METSNHNRNLDNIYHSLAGLNVVELDKVMAEILQLRKQKLPTILSRRETELLHFINMPPPTDIQERYDLLVEKSMMEKLTDPELLELQELTTYMENLSVKRLGYLIELAQVRSISLDELMEQLEIKPRLNVA